MRKFFAQLISDFRDHGARSPRSPRVALDREFWLRINALCEPFLEAQTKWKTTPDDVSRDSLENTLMAFWTGFGQLPAEIVSRTLSKEALATWRVIDDEAHGIQRDPTLEEARERYFVVPRLPARSLSMVRTGETPNGTQVSLFPPQLLNNAHTFAIPEQWPKANYWRIRSRDGLQMAMPLEGNRDHIQEHLGARTRDLLNGGVMRLWMATWVLAHEQKDPLGGFKVVPKHVVCELFGKKPEVTTAANGKRYERTPRLLERELWRQMEVLQNIYLCGVGDVTANTPEPLVQRYINEPESKQLFQHAPLAWRFARMAFTQVPRAVLQLDSASAPLALGVANLWRAHMTSTIRGSGRYTTTLPLFATEVGEDYESCVRHDGRAYWVRLVERLKEVLSVGQLGTVHVAGEGFDATITLEPSETLASVYRSLVEASDRHREQAQKVDHEVAVRTKLLNSLKPASRKKN